MSSRIRLLVLSISTPILAVAVIGGFLGKASAGEDTYQHLRVFEDVVSLITNNYVEEVEMDEVMEGAMRGLTEGLDPESSFLRPSEVRLVEQGTPVPEAGPGITLTRQYYLRVLAVRDGSPAARAGLTAGDFIRAIDGKSTRDVSLFAGTRLLHGAAGSKVSLTVIRGSAAEPHVVELVRENPPALEVAARIAAPSVGYLRVPAFGPKAAEAIGARIVDLTRQGATRLILDLRGTAEGPFESGLAAARLFVASGTLATLEGRAAAIETFTAQPNDGAIALPISILIDGGTAGAAEIFAAALQGNGRADLIGEKTYGRAANQKLVKLPDGSGLWMSSTRYVAPAGTAIHAKGLTPTTEVEAPAVEFGETASADPILEKALERLAANKAA